MRKLTINETVTTDPRTILSEQKRFYQNLYTSGRNETDNRYAAKSFLNNLNIPKLSEEEKQSCEGKLLETFQNNKAPGNDGIPVEFYKKLRPLISEPFIKCVNECFEKKELSSSQNQAVITLIEKKGKDRTWRPISLLNVDTKIMSKVIASRLKNVLPNAIHYNQTVGKIDFCHTGIFSQRKYSRNDDKKKKSF